MTVYLIRHGESKANFHKDLPLQSGYALLPDALVPLTEWGYEQAKEAGKALARELQETERPNRKIKIIYSPYLRAVQTTRGILRQLGSRDNLIAISDNNLHEQQFGKFTSVTDHALAEAIWGEEYTAYRAARRVDRYRAKPPEGESPEDVVARAQLVIDAHRADFEDPDTDVIVVAHGTVNRALELCLCNRVEEWNMTRNPENCAIRKLEGDLRNGYASNPDYIHSGKPRPASLPKDHKIAAYDADRAIAR